MRKNSAISSYGNGFRNFIMNWFDEEMIIVIPGAFLVVVAITLLMAY
jgi:hypothetical protein